jgi:hypothetical protein
MIDAGYARRGWSELLCRLGVVRQSLSLETGTGSEGEFVMALLR